MKGEEVQSLVGKKLREGKDFPEINEEIEELKESQVIFKNQEKELKRLNNKILSQDNEIKELKNKLFKLNLERDTKREDKRTEIKTNGDSGGDSLLRNLRRIVLILRAEGRPCNLSYIEQNCFLDNKKLLPCLGFLEEVGVLKMDRDEKNIQRWGL